ncbi:MAG: serine/threonine protein kinase [Lentisphaeraceae bacterium]|nr:serine/threonine protein kinase [Lentisphaeraceae bacterium]
MNLEPEKFTNLGNFCEESFEDSWEDREAKEEYDAERYQDKEFIASGSQKNVFKVFDDKMKRHIALAELREDIPEELYEDFFTEASLTSSLRHPNIVTVYDYGFTEAYLPYFTMEIKVGKTLSKVISNQQKSLTELLDIFLKICDAIAYSHSQQIVHLDLKPSNIQVGEYGEVQVCDWGLSRKIDRLKTGSGLNGTPGYMAPEQTIEGKELDERTDIYALGGILYNILTEDTPVKGGLETVLNATLYNDLVAPSERCPNKNIPGSLDAVVNKALAWHKEARYQSVEEFKSEVAQYLMGRSTTAENAGVFKEFTLFVKRNKQVCSLSFISIFALLLSVGVFVFEIQKSKAETEAALGDLRQTHAELQVSKQQEKDLFEEKKKAFDMYRAATEERKSISSQLVGQQLNYAHELMIYPLFFGSPVESLDKSLKILTAHSYGDRSQEGIKDLIVINLFISQKFKELKSFKSEKYKSLIELAKKYERVEVSGVGVLLDKDYINLLKDLNSLSTEEQSLKQEVMERSLCYAMDAKGVNFIHGKTVKELIFCWNPDWNPEKFEHNKSKKFVRAYGGNLSKLRSRDINSSQKCFIRFLKVDSLDLSGSPDLSSLSQIDGLYVKTVDIRDTSIKNLHPHHATKSIETVYLSHGQLDLTQNFKVPKSVQLIYKD